MFARTLLAILLASMPFTSCAVRPVASTAESRPVTFPIRQDRTGRQTQRGADNDIHSRPFGLTIAGFQSKLRWNADRVWLVYSYSSTEVGGDRTTIKGGKTIDVAQARPGYRITDVDSYGRTEVAYGNSYHGTVRNPLIYTNEAYWARVQMVVDTDQENDVPYVGIMGGLRFKVYEEKR